MKQKILIVEDDKNIVKALTIRLKAKGYEVAVAQDAVMAASVAMKQPPDLVLLDISLPGGNGFVVAERLQNAVLTAGVRMIFLTASKQPGLREKAMAFGAVDFFEKPYEAEDLLAAIHIALAAPLGSLPPMGSQEQSL